MTSTEIAVRSNGAITTERDVVDGWITVAADVSKLSDYIADTDFVPKGLRNKPAAIAACILTGRELGIGPMASLKSIHMVQGVPSLSAEYKRARALAAGHQIVIDESTSTRCVVRGRRAGSDAWVTITWAFDMATRAKLTGKDVWKQYPQRMLQARATSELCDLLFPDASLGLPTTEELEDGGAVLAGEIVAQAADETAPPVPAAPQGNRRRRATPVTVKSAAPPPPAAPEPPADDLPPLPGEDEMDPTAAPGATQTTHQGSPAPAGEPDSTDYDIPGTVTRAQLTKLGATFTGLEFTRDERDQRLAAASVIVGRDLDSSSDLSKTEASMLIDTLERCGTRDRLIELLAASDAPGGDTNG